MSQPLDSKIQFIKSKIPQLNVDQRKQILCCILYNEEVHNNVLRVLRNTDTMVYLDRLHSETITAICTILYRMKL